MADTVTNQLQRCKEELAKLLQKGYPQAMVEFFDEKIAEVTTVIGATKTLYAHHVVEAEAVK
eukprot:2775954-Lingulodinium_polyedra.AAC.1